MHDNTETEIWLLGQPLLNDYLYFIDDAVVEGQSMDKRALVAEWSAANDYYHKLSVLEKNIADSVGCQTLKPELSTHIDALKQDARFRHTFNRLPTRFGLVELDKLVVYQLHVTETFIKTLTKSITPTLSDDALCQFCLPLEAASPVVHGQKMGTQRYLFQSVSSDFQFQEALLLKSEQLQHYENYGKTTNMLGLAVGFGSNFLNVIEDDDSKRLLLHNGYHRACALRAQGITHAPCIIQTVTRRDELDMIAYSTVAKSPGYYFNAPRPPLLKDFFDCKIRKILPIKKRLKAIEISFDIKEYWLYQ